MKVVEHRKIYFIVSAILFLLSIGAMFMYGFNTSIDFKGGSFTEVSFEVRPTQSEIEEKIRGLEIGGFSVRPSGENNHAIRSKELTQEESANLLSAIGNPTVEKQTTIGPIAGRELRSKAVKAVSVVILMIVLFITFAFRKVSKPVSSWKYGLATIVALLHDVVIPLGIFVVLGHYFLVEIDLLFVTGILAILGYSVHDSIVVFDRVRENLRINQEKNINEEFELTVGKSINQTMARSINTSVTIFITLLALYIWGSPATEHFTLLLLIGVIAGTYSSIFVASPLLVTFYKLQKKN